MYVNVYMYMYLHIYIMYAQGLFYNDLEGDITSLCTWNLGPENKVCNKIKNRFIKNWCSDLFFKKTA